MAIYAAANVFFAAYALAARRAVEARARNEALAADLRQANQRLTESSERAERLGAARERQRLARDLHDSVTQTLFSMTLTARSALLLLRREPREVPAQLDQIDAPRAQRPGGDDGAGRRAAGLALPAEAGSPAPSGGTAPSASCGTGWRSASRWTATSRCRRRRRRPSCASPRRA